MLRRFRMVSKSLLQVIAGFYFICLVPEADAAGLRIALVMGNSVYDNASSLPNPPNDADLMEQTLHKAGFTVTKVIDADFQRMRRVLLDFGRSLRGADIEASLFFYAGHGVQVRGENYLIPIDAAIASEDEVDLQAVNVNDFLRVMNSSSSPINIVVLDACRDNPFSKATRSLASRGLAPIDAPKGTMVAYATAPGQLAQDGREANSPYTAALASAIDEYGQEPIETVFKRARQIVLKATKGGQVPWETSSMTGDFYFRKIAPVLAPQDKIGEAAGRMTATPTSDHGDIAGKFEIARGMGNESAWQAFLGEYGDQEKNFYVVMAKDALALLLKPQTEVMSPPDAVEVFVRPAVASETCRKARFDVGSATLCVTSILESTSDNEYGSGNLTDGRKSTAWVEGVRGDGLGEYISVEFGEPVTISEVLLANGYDKNRDIFIKNNRVRGLSIITSDGEELKSQLSDNSNWQSLSSAFPKKIKWLMLKIASVYPGSKYTDTAISGLQIR